MSVITQEARIAPRLSARMGVKLVRIKGRVLTYAFLVAASVVVLMPLYVMLVTSLKSMEEIRTGSMLALPSGFDFAAWAKAWSAACTGMACGGVSAGFLNSVMIVVPAVAVSIAFGIVTGYAFALTKIRLGGFVFAILMLGTFLPWQIFVFPLGRVYAALGLYGSIWSLWITHVFFTLPISMLLFRNYFKALPEEIVKAARVDGASFLQLLWYVLLPMSGPMIAVAAILLTTLIWNDFVVGVVFGGRQYFPMTVQLNNIVNSQFGQKEYNVNMAATLLTAAVPLLVYFFSGRWFVRGIAAGAVKG
jgi:glucose/mannose transport system permease protein